MLKSIPASRSLSIEDICDRAGLLHRYHETKAPSTQFGKHLNDSITVWYCKTAKQTSVKIVIGNGLKFDSFLKRRGNYNTVATNRTKILRKVQETITFFKNKIIE